MRHWNEGLKKTDRLNRLAAIPVYTRIEIDCTLPAARAAASSFPRSAHSRLSTMLGPGLLLPAVHTIQ